MKFKNVEDIYPLSALQQLMLLSTLSSKNGKGKAEHLKFTLKGSLVAEDLEKAWTYIVRRHAALRTAFYWQGLPKPVQAVKKKVPIEFTYHDYRNEGKSSRELVDSYVEADLERGIQLDSAPLVRMAVLKTGEEEFSILLSYTAIIIDGWSMVTVLKEFFNQLLKGEASEAGDTPPTKFRDYIAWLQQRDSESDERWWQTYLDGFKKPTPLWVNRELPSSPSEKGRFTIERRVPETDKDALLGFARENRTTLNAMVQLAWAMLLGHYADTDDVVFGSAVSGRPPYLTGVETMVGAFINNVPVRVRIDQNKPIKEILSELTINMLDLKEHEHTSPARIQQLSQVELSDHLYETVVLFQNFPIEGSLWEKGRNFTICNVEKEIEINFPLTLACIPRDDIDIQLIFNGPYWDETLSNKMANDFVSILSSLAKNPNASAQSLLLPIQRPAQGKLCHITKTQRPPAVRQSNSASLTTMEEKVASIWKDILGLSLINSGDNFFDLGGRSVQVIAVHSRLCALGYNSLSLVELFDFPTVAQLASKLAGNDASDNGENDTISLRAKKRNERIADKRKRITTIQDHQE